MSGTYKVKLATFEGPLDLLLHLINELEIDIYDIPVAEITEQYMNYIHAMQTIELNIASEYLVMAATLLEMKSAMLLPKKQVIHEDEYEEDPREQLMNRLIEYRKYKEAAENLKQQELNENEIFTRPPVHFDEFITTSPVVQGDLSIFDMLHALQKVFKRKSWNEPLETTVNRVEISIEQRMEEIIQLVEDIEQPVLFENLFPFKTKSHIVTTFLAILQLLKNNKISCVQANNFEPLYIGRSGGEHLDN